MAVDSRPIPAATPIAAVTHMPAAVVNPRGSTCLVPKIMAPAPRNPTPAIRPCNTRVKSAADAPACWGIRTKSAAPMATSICVRTPALLPSCSRSYPSKPPRAAATRRRSAMRVICVASGISENSDSTVFHISCHMLIVTSRFSLLHPVSSRSRPTSELPGTLHKPRSGLLLWRVRAWRHVRPQGGAHEATHGPALVHLCVRMSIGASHLTLEFFDRKVLCPRRSGYQPSDIVTKRFAPAEAPSAARDSVSFARHDS